MTAMSTTIDSVDAALSSRWVDRLCQAARAEGWDVFYCGDSDNGPVQIQCLDCPEDLEVDGVVPPTLEEDVEAWAIVAKGTGEHHRQARAIVAELNPLEWACMQRAVGASL